MSVALNDVAVSHIDISKLEDEEKKDSTSSKKEIKVEDQPFELAPEIVILQN